MKATITAALSAALLLAPVAADAHTGVRAAVKHGTLEVQGGDRSETVVLRLAQNNPSILEVDASGDNTADYSFNRASIDAIRVRMGDGDDTVRIDDSQGAVEQSSPTTIAGGDGADTLLGGQADETFKSGDGNDVVDGGRGADTAIQGDGNDVFVWDPGEGSDVIEGQDGTDTMVFNGAGGAETVNISANGRRLTFFRQPGSVTMDTDGVEIVDFNALGGQDIVTVNDLSGTDVAQTNIDLASSLGGNAADKAQDTVTVNGTEGDDHIAVTGNGSGADVTGLASAVSVTHADPANPADLLSVNTKGGNDDVAVSGVAGLLQLLVNGAPA